MAKEFVFEANGVKFRLEVDENGFCLWDASTHQWILDASTIGYTASFEVGGSELESTDMHTKEYDYGTQVFIFSPKGVPPTDPDELSDKHWGKKDNASA